MNTAGSAVTLPPLRRDYLAVLSFCVLWILFWYRETALAMVGIWARSETFTHGFVVPPIVLWMIWRQRNRLSAVSPRPNLWVLPLLCLAGLAWLLGDLAAVNAVTQFAFVAMLALVVPAIFGMQFARPLAFPLGFLFFAVPIGEFALPQLMDWTADFTVFALRLSAVPVYREGLQFVIPSGTWSVVEACSGVRYLIASLMVGVLFAYLNYTSLKRRLIFIGVSVIVPIIANWLRAYLIVMLGHLSSNKLAVGVDHLIYGWIFFGLVIAIMFFIGSRWAEHQPADVAPAPSSVQAATDRRFWAATILVAGLATAPHLAKLSAADDSAADSPRLPEALADVQGGWQPASSAFTDWQPAFADPSAEMKATFNLGDQTVGLYVGYYRNQNYDRKLVSSTNVLVSSQDHAWAQVSRGTKALGLDHGTLLSFRTAQLHAKAADLRNNAPRLLAWQIYWINGHLTANAHLAKAYTALSRMLGRGDDSAVIILYAPIAPPHSAELALESFATANLKVIETMLSEASAHR